MGRVTPAPAHQEGAALRLLSPKNARRACPPQFRRELFYLSAPMLAGHILMGFTLEEYCQNWQSGFNPRFPPWFAQTV